MNGGADAAGTLALGGDLVVNRIGFGAMRLCGPGIWGEPQDPQNARAVLRRALELGVQLIDTADAYGPEVNEHQIADALHPYPEGLVIATKGSGIRPSRDEWGVDDLQGAVVRAAEPVILIERQHPHLRESFAHQVERFVAGTVVHDPHTSGCPCRRAQTGVEPVRAIPVQNQQRNVTHAAWKQAARRVGHVDKG